MQNLLRSARVLPVLLLSLFVFSGCQMGLLGFQEDPPPTAGLYDTFDRGESWRYISGNNPGLTAYATSTIKLDPNVPSVVYYAPDLAGIYRSWDRGENWENINAGLPVSFNATVSDIVFSTDDSNTIYLVGSFDGIGRVVVGDNAGENWDYLYTELPAGTEITSFAVDLNNANILYAVGTTKPFLVSEDRGATWRATHWFTQIPLNLKIHPDNPSLVLVVVDGEGLMHTRDQGENWQMMITRSEVGAIHQLTFNPLRTGSIYLAADSGLFFSDNEGQTWSRLTDSLPVRGNPILSVDFHPTDPDVLYLTVSNNIYITYNHGRSWEVHKLGIPNNLTHLIVDPLDPDHLYVGTR